jgi:hypothetical protein
MLRSARYAHAQESVAGLRKLESRRCAVTEDQPAPERATIPIIKDNELRLAKMRRQLEGMFRALDLVHDEISVAAEAARSECQPEIASVLSLSVCNRLFGQLKLLTNVIERLGGRTDLSEVPESAEETTQTKEERL